VLLGGLAHGNLAESSAEVVATDQREPKSPTLSFGIQ
jgi:hypothetical protein